MITFLLASLITTASIVFPTDCPTGNANQTVTGGSTASAASACNYSGEDIGGSAEAQAQTNYLQVSASALDFGYEGVEITGEAQYSGIAPVGPDIFTFHLTGDMYSDGSWPEMVFTLTTGGVSQSTEIHVEGGHFNYIDATWSSTSIQTEGPYIADLKLVVTGQNQGTGGGAIEATLVGIEDPVAQVPEPSSAILVLIPLMLMFRRRAARSS